MLLIFYKRSGGVGTGRLAGGAAIGEEMTTQLLLLLDIGA